MKILFSIFSFVFFPYIVLASAQTTCFEASGFGNSNANGLYEWYDANGGNQYGQMPDRYSNSTNFYIYTIVSEGVILMDPTIGSGGADYYIVPADTQNFDYTATVGSWSLNAGTNPAGAVTIEDCPSSPDPVASSTPVATTTEALLGSLAFGNAVIIGLLSLFFISFLFSSINKKNPWS